MNITEFVLYTILKFSIDSTVEVAVNNSGVSGCTSQCL